MKLNVPIRLAACLAGGLLIWATASAQVAATLTTENGERLSGYVTKRAEGKVYFHSSTFGDIVAPESAVTVVENPPAAESPAVVPAPAPAAPVATAAVSPASGKEASDVVVMSQYVVDTSKDTGYLAKNTLSAFGTASNLMDVPANIQIANKELLTDLAFDSPLYAANYVAGGVTRRSFNAGDDQFIWGFRAQATLMDGVQFGLAGAGVTTMYEIDHVEIIKGPAGLLFGQDAYTGGMINYIRRQPTATPQAEITASFGSFNEKRGEAHVSGPITKKLGYRLDLGSTNSNYSDQKFSFYRDYAVGAGIAYDFSKSTKLTVMGSAVNSIYLPGQTFADPNTGHVFAAPSASFTTEQPWAFFKSPSEMVTATLTSTIADGFESRTYVGYRNFRESQTNPYYNGIDLVNHNLTGYVYDGVLTKHYVSIEQDFVKDFTTGFLEHKFVVGYEQRDDIQSSISTGYTLPAFNYLNPTYGPLPPSAEGSGAATANSKTRDRVTGIYAQDLISLWRDRVTLVFGGRFNDFFRTTGAPVPPTGGTKTEQDQSKNVGRFGIIIHPIEHTTLYYQHAQAFLFNTNLDAYDNPLPPQTGQNDEVGAKVELFNGAVMATVTYFDLRLTNVATTYIEPAGYPRPGTAAAEALGQSTNKGYEIDINYSKKFAVGELNAIATVYHGNVRDNFGNRVLGPANNTNSLFATFKFANGIGFGAGENFQGLRDGDSYNTLPQTPRVKWDAYTRADALAFYRFKNFKFQVNLDNIDDKHYVEGDEFSEWVYVNPGRALKVSATYRY